MDTASAQTAALRLAAEKQLAAKKAWLTPDADVDQFKMLHELQVHQIELEMQNETLRETLAQAESLRLKYQDLFEHAPVGYFMLSHAGEILELNHCGARMLGQAADKLAGRQMREFFENSSLAHMELFITTVRQSREEIFAHSLLIRRKMQMPLYVNMQARRVDDSAAGMSQIRLTMMDISELKNAKDDAIHAIGKVSGFAPL